MLIVREPRYLSYLDEKSFYSWLESIEGVAGVQGCVQGLRVDLVDVKVGRSCLSDLIALFVRYSMDVRFLSDVIEYEDKEWFSDPSAYWHAHIS